MRYVVVFRDHAGDWHAIYGPVSWRTAATAFGSMVSTLMATDYYDDCSPTVAKIVSADGAGSDYYAQAPALAGEQ